MAVITYEKRVRLFIQGCIFRFLYIFQSSTDDIVRFSCFCYWIL